MAEKVHWAVRLTVESDEKKAVQRLAEAEMRSINMMASILLREGLAARETSSDKR